MYIRNGGLVIITKVKQFLSRKASLRIFLMIALVLFGMVPVLVVSVVVKNTFISAQMENKISNVQNSSLIMATQLSKGDYLQNTDNDVLNAQLVQLANFYGGRVQIMNSSYKVIEDTYVVNEGKYNISEIMLKSMDLNRSLTETSGWDIEVAHPIIKQTDKQISGVMLFSVEADDISAASQRLSFIIEIVDIIVFIVILVLSYFIAALLMRPLKNLVNKFKNAARYNIQEDIEVSTYKETRAISDSYNKMLAKLKTIDESRQQFVSNVSHELKTPITSIKVLADSLIMQEDAPAELYREFMTDIAKEIDRENMIIEDLLSLVKLDKTANSLNISETKINDLLEALLKQLSPIASVKNVELILESFRPVMAEVDEMKLTLAFSNLIENAIKYNKEGGWVRVILNADHKFFYVKVVDNGIGIPEGEQEKVFERFYRVDKARSRESGGTGLGLAISQSIVFTHKGAIKLYSKPGEGSTFTVRIPLIYIE